MNEIDREFRRGFITEDERYNQTVDVWRETTDEVTEQMLDGPRQAWLGLDDHPLRRPRKRAPRSTSWPACAA